MQYILVWARISFVWVVRRHLAPKPSSDRQRAAPKMVCTLTKWRGQSKCCGQPRWAILITGPRLFDAKYYVEVAQRCTTKHQARDMLKNTKKEFPRRDGWNVVLVGVYY